jgi:hypothetical protein
MLRYADSRQLTFRVALGTSLMTDLADKSILLGVTGGIAAYKAATIASLAVQAGASVEVVMTEAAQQFVPIRLRGGMVTSQGTSAWQGTLTLSSSLLPRQRLSPGLHSAWPTT